MTSPAPDSKPPLNEQIADIILKVIMMGGVASGGLGAFWSLFKESDVPKAIASAGIGLGISYAAKMLQPLHESTQQRAEAVGKTIDRAVGETGGHLVSAVLRGEDKYLQCQAWDCQQYKPDGIALYDDIKTPLLEEVFVPLRLDGQSLAAGFGRLGRNSQRQNGTDQAEEAIEKAIEAESRCPPKIWDFLREAASDRRLRQIAILAWGGLRQNHFAAAHCLHLQPQTAGKISR